MKLTKRFTAIFLACFILVSSALGHYQKAYAMDVVIGGTAVVAVEYAIAYLLAFVGLVSASALVYENADSLRAWGSDCMDDFYEYCQGYNEWAYLTEKEINAWMDDVASGTLEKASDVWEAFKEWISQSYEIYYTGDNILYMSSYSYKYNIDPSIVSNVAIPDNYIFSYDDSGDNYTRVRDCYYAKTYDGGYRFGAYISNTGSISFNLINSRNSILYYKPHTVTFYNGKWTGSVDHDSGVSSNSSDFMTLVENSTAFPVYRTEEELNDYLKTGNIGHVYNQFTGENAIDSPYGLVGGIGDIYERDKSLEYVDVINPGALAGDTTVPIDWQHISDLTGTLGGIQAGTLDSAKVWENLGVDVIDTTLNPDVPIENDFPWFGDIIGWLKKLYGSLSSIPANIIDSLKGLLVSLFVPSDTYFDGQIELTMNTLKSVLPYTDYINMLKTVKSFSAGELEDITVTIMGATATVVSFSHLRLALPTIRSWARGLFFLLMLIYHINQTYKLIRNTKLFDGMFSSGGG